jgi:hypothetical protein
MSGCEVYGFMNFAVLATVVGPDQDQCGTSGLEDRARVRLRGSGSCSLQDNNIETAGRTAPRVIGRRALSRRSITDMTIAMPLRGRVGASSPRLSLSSTAGRLATGEWVVERLGIRSATNRVASLPGCHNAASDRIALCRNIRHVARPPWSPATRHASDPATFHAVEER